MLKFLNSRRFRQGSIATAITAIVIALIVVLNMLVTTLSDRYLLSLDLTAEKVFGISEETKGFLHELGKDVDIFILTKESDFASGGDYAIQANEVIKKYAQESSHIKVQYIDFVRNPAFAARFPTLQLNTSSIVVACGDRAVDLTVYDIYNIEADPNTGRSGIVSSKAEQAMTSAMLEVTSDKQISVAMITGHNESTLEGLQNLLALNYFNISEVNLLTEEIGSDIELAIMCAPMRDLTLDELKKLDKYLDNSGRLGTNLLYFAASDQPDLPNLSAFLADWGVEVGDGLVFEYSLNRVMNMDMLMPIVSYDEDVYAKTVLERGMPTLIAYSRPLNVLFDAKGSIKVESALSFSQTSGVLPPDIDENWQPKETDLIGPIPALAVSQKTAYEGTTKLNSSVIVCGSSLAVEDSFLAAPSLGNGEYFLSLINIITNRKESVNIQSKTIGGHELGINGQQQLIIGLLFVLILPLAVLIFGIVVWLRRRHR